MGQRHFAFFSFHFRIKNLGKQLSLLGPRTKFVILFALQLNYSYICIWERKRNS